MTICSSADRLHKTQELQVTEQVTVKIASCLDLTYLVKGSVDGDDVTLLDHLCNIWHVPAVQRLLQLGRQLLVVSVQQLPAVKPLQRKSMNDNRANHAKVQATQASVMAESHTEATRRYMQHMRYTFRPISVVLMTPATCNVANK